jgi:hypothetical protein
MSPKQWEAAENAKLVPLERPRQLTGAERSLLDLLIAPLDCEELAEQVAHAQVVGRCTCGCPSVTLHSDAPPVPAAVMEPLTRGTGRDDVLEITASETSDYAGELQVTLHVSFGDVVELEVWGADKEGELVTEVPAVDVLTHRR